MASSSGIGGGPTPINLSAVEQKAAIAKSKEANAEQEASEIGITQNPDFTNPAAATRTRKKETSFKSLSTRRKTTSTTKEKTIKSIEERQKHDDLSQQYQEENQELDADVLNKLKNKVSENSTPEDILSLVEASFSDPVLAFSSLEFLSASTKSPKLQQAIQQAKDSYQQKHLQAIKGGKNVLFASQEFGSQLQVSPSSLRSLYLNVTTSILSSNELFTLLSSQYTREEQKTVSSFLLQGMSSDLKSEGPSIDPTKLQVLMSEIKSLQAVLNLYSFFQDSMPRLSLMMKSDNVALPKDVTYETLAKTFQAIVMDKFPTHTKIQRAVQEISGGDPDIMSNILNLFYQALTQSSPRLFASAEQRQQLGLTIANTLDILNVNNDDYPHPNIFPQKPLN